MDNTTHLYTRIIRADQTESAYEREILSEHQLLVTVNELPVFSLTCTRENLRELCIGRLYTEGIIAAPSEVAKIYFCRYENEASIFLNKEIIWESVENRVASCCTNNRTLLTGRGRRALEPVKPLSFPPDWIFSLARAFFEGTRLHTLTQAAHSCFLQRNGEVLFQGEDIGRHNALDKAIGYALLHEIPLSECILYTSGRVPVDMVEKVIAAGVPVLVSKSVPTAESVALAEEYGLTIIGRAFPEQFEQMTV